MEAILQAHNCTVPAREILDALAQRFSSSAERAGKVEVSVKQVWNWFQNRRYAIRARAARASVPGTVHIPPAPRDDPSVVKIAPQAPYSHPPQPQASHPLAPQLQPAPSTAVRSLPQAPQPHPAPSVVIEIQLESHLKFPIF